MNAHSQAMQMHAHSVQMAHHANHQAMHAANQAMHQGMRAHNQARHMAAMAASQARRAAAMGRRSAAMQNESLRNAAILKHKELVASLIRATTQRPLDCTLSYHNNGSMSLLLGRNWTDEQGGDHVVLLCNTKLPGSGRPAAVFLLSEDRVSWVDLINTSLSELVKRGRLFIYPGRNVEASNSLAILHATFEDERGSVGHWAFATAGSFHGKPFVVGEAAFGGFIDRAYQDVIVARPLNYSSAAKQWIWYGRSSTREEERMIVKWASPFEDENATIRYALPASGNTSVAALRCTQRDDRGDPIAVFDTRADSKHIIQRLGDTLYLLCPANRKLPSGEAVFIAPTRSAKDGAMVFAGSGLWNGNEIRFELEANHEFRGQQVLYKKAKAFLGKQKVAAIPLRSLG